MPKRSDPHYMSQWFLNHPWQAAAASGVLAAAWGVVVSQVAWRLSMVVGLLMFLVVGMAWREGGPGYRWRQWMLRKFPKDPPKGS